MTKQGERFNILLAFNSRLLEQIIARQLYYFFLLDVQCLDSFGIITSNQEFAARTANKSVVVMYTLNQPELRQSLELPVYYHKKFNQNALLVIYSSPSAQPLPSKVTLRPVGGEAISLV